MRGLAGPTLATTLVLTFLGAEPHLERGQARQDTVPPLAVTRVPSPGSWGPGAQIERVVHAFDLPGTDNELLLCAGSGNSTQWAAQRKFVCYRYDRNTSQYSTFNTPSDWFCNAAIHLDDGKILVVGGTAIDGYPNTNNGKWLGTSETYTYAPTTGQVTRIGDVTPEWYPGLLEDQVGGVYKHGGGTNGVMTDVWEYLAQGQTTWSRVPWVWRTRYYSDIRLIGTNLAAYTGATSTPSANRPPSILNLSTGKRIITPGLRNPTLRKSAASVLLYPAQDKKVLVIGGGSQTGPAIPDVDLIDYSVYPQRVPSFVPKASLPQGMMLVLTVLLPNGQLFATGGNTTWRGTSVLWAAIYDPVNDAWIRVATPHVGRNYHSAIMTGLDGRVSTFGGNPSAKVFEDDEEIYSPWYMTEPRPVIVNHPSTMTYGGSYDVDVTMPAGAELGYFTLDRARAETHVYVPNQTMPGLPFTVDSTGNVTVQVPTDRALLPPGYYKLAVNTSDYVPSRQVWVRIG
jgi:Galactose oxidase-like, Early set domain